MSVEGKRTRNSAVALPDPINVSNLEYDQFKPQSYCRSYGIYNEAPAALMVLPGICDENRHFRVLIESLLYPAVVDALAAISLVLFLGLILSAVVLVAQVAWASIIARLVLVRLAALGGAGFTLVGS